MVVMAPKDENELRRMLVTALDYNGPAAIRYPRGAAVGVALEEPIRPISIGEAEILAEGKDVVILAIGRMAEEAMTARERLSSMGIEATVVNCRFVKPLDEKLICRLVKETPRVVTAEENVLRGGFGSAVLECLAEAGLHEVRIARVGVKDRFIEHGDAALLRAKWGIDHEGIVSAE